MTTQAPAATNYHCGLLISAPVSKVYAALTTPDGFRGWWTATCDISTEVGGISTFRFDQTYKVMQIESLQPGREVRWQCVDAHIHAPDRLTRTNEWVGTSIVFRLLPQPSSTTLLRVEHVGLTPDIECYDMCSNGWDHFLDSLKAYAETGTGTPYIDTNPMSTSIKPFTISQTFDGARDRLWKAWTELDQLEQWFGPKGVQTTAIKREFKPGGIFHYKMKTPDGKEMWGRFTYREITAPEKLVWVNSFSDEHAGVTRHPFAATWPLEMLTTVTFIADGNKTVVTVEWLPLNANEAELKMFDGAREGMKGGWNGSFEQLTAYLAKK